MKQMRRLIPTALIAAVLLIAPVNAGQPIQIYLDGQQVGTLDNLEYRMAEGEIHITTNERVVGCRQDRVFWDRWEQ